MTSLWPSQGLLLSSVSSPRTPSCTSAAGMKQQLPNYCGNFAQRRRSSAFCPHPWLLCWCLCVQGSCRGTVAALPGWAGGGVRPPGAQETHFADAGLVCGHPPSCPLHPRYRTSDIADRRAGRLLHLCFSRYTIRYIFFPLLWLSDRFATVVSAVLFCHWPGLCLMQAKLSETDDRSSRWGIAKTYFFSFIS